MANKRLFQICSARELQPAVLASGLIAAANATVQVKDPKFDFNQEEYQREVNSGNLSPDQTLTGKIKAEVSFAVELAGTTVANAAPPWAHLLDACYFHRANMFSATFGDLTGTPVAGLFGGTATGVAKHFYNGQLLQTAGAAKVIRVIHDTYEGQTFIFYEHIVGVTANSDVFFPVTSDVTIGPAITLTGGSLTSQKGYAWSPVSKAISTVDVTLTSGAAAVDDILVGATSGAVLRVLEAITTGTARKFEILDGLPAAGGEAFNNKTQAGVVTTTTSTWAMSDVPTLSMALIEDGRIKIGKGFRGTPTIGGEPGQPIFMNFTFTGLLAAIQDGGTLSGVTLVSKVPPKLQGVDLKIGSFTSGEPGYFNHATAHSPKLLGFTLDLGGSPNVESDATQDTGYTGSANQTGRRASQGTLKCGQRPDASFPFLRKQRDNEPFWLKLRVAKNTAAFTNNAFLISTPGCFIKGNNSTDNDGYAADELNLGLSSRRPDGPDGEGGELVISYHFSGATAW